MSQEDVERVRSAVEAWNRRDADLWTTYAAPEVEWMPAGPAAVEGTVYRGYEEVASGLESVWQTWDEVSFEESEVRDLGEAVLWLGRLKLRGATSGVELDQEFAVRFGLRDRQLVTVQAFLGWQAALEAVERSE
jgi:ketosteroid isomerase-like protein